MPHLYVQTVFVVSISAEYSVSALPPFRGHGRIRLYGPALIDLRSFAAAYPKDFRGIEACCGAVTNVHCDAQFSS